ncbi:MAG: hypothetical protein M3Z54_09860 [Gemmatimonadota bacterium]|nr:hypothetical protein [Gemmatimonadota bacterium]
MRIGYDGAIKLAINDFHKHANPRSGLVYLGDLLAKLKLTNPQRALGAEYTLQGYMEWYVREQPIVAACKARVELELGHDVILGGEVSRVDVLVAQDRYRGILLGEFDPSNWRAQLRMPLLQRAIAVKFERGEEDVVVGVQNLDGSGLDTHSYSQRSLENAETEAKTLARTISGLLSD